MFEEQELGPEDLSIDSKESQDTTNQAIEPTPIEPIPLNTSSSTTQVPSNEAGKQTVSSSGTDFKHEGLSFVNMVNYDYEIGRAHV